MLTIQIVSGIKELKPDSAGYMTFDNVIEIKAETTILIVDVDPCLPLYIEFLKWCTNSVRHALIITKREEVGMLEVVERMNVSSNYGTLFYLTGKELDIINVTFVGAVKEVKELPYKSTKLYKGGTVYIIVTSGVVSVNDEKVDCVISGGEATVREGSGVSVKDGCLTVKDVVFP